MATSIASVTGAVIATFASSGAVSAETNSDVSPTVEPNLAKAGRVTIEQNPDFYLRFTVNGDRGPNGLCYEDYMKPIRVNGDVVYCVEPQVYLNGDETVTRAIPLSQGATFRKPGGTYQVSGDVLIAAAFIDWFMFRATDAQIEQVVKNANEVYPGEGDQMKLIRYGVKTRLNNNSDKATFLMQLYYWWGASANNINIQLAQGSTDKMNAYWSEMASRRFAIPGAKADSNGGEMNSAINWMVRLRNLYAHNLKMATYNNDGYILETSGDNQRLFSMGSFTPKSNPTPPALPAATPEIGTMLKDDKGLKTVNAKPIILIDTVSYKNLKPGTEYTVSGRLMDKETGKDLNPAVTATTKFKPTSANGTVDIKFTLDASKLGGKKVVAFEKVSEGGTVVATHEDINDEGQTVLVKKPIPPAPPAPSPEIGTTLKDDKGAKEVEPKQVTLVDTVKYTNLIVGKEYEVSGRLMDKETGKELEPAVTGSTKFTATQSDGSIDITFTFDASRLAGKRVVAFEKVSEGGKLVASHEDINDDDQTVKVKAPNPSIGTTLTDDKGAKEVEPVQVTLVDKVAYTNLTVGKEYTVTGRLMDKETGKELEPAVTGSTKFTPTEPSGTVDVTFTFDASKLAGKKVVAFEKVSEGEKEVAVHEDINDEGQTIVVKTPNPSIGTTLKDEQGAKDVEPKQVTLIDTVKYTNLTVGKEYEVTGRLMDKETGKELEPAVTGSTKFTPTESNGTVDVKFTFDASKLAGKRVVAFEKVSDGEREVAVHEDINDEDQTVTIKKLNPEIGTTLINKATGDHKASPDKEVTLVDTVKYKNLEVGKEYEVTGRLMDKATGKEFEPAVKATAKFKPTASEGSVDVTFTFDASALAGRSVVAFEVITLDGQVVATHEDINDEGQTVEFTTPETPKPSESKPKETPKTKVTPKTGVKGMNYGLVGTVGAAFVALAVISYLVYRKKSH